MLNLYYIMQVSRKDQMADQKHSVINKDRYIWIVSIREDGGLTNYNSRYNQYSIDEHKTYIIRFSNLN
jgi:hypothetical protein